MNAKIVSAKIEGHILKRVSPYYVWLTGDFVVVRLAVHVCRKL
jgi:hypothetical protein